MDRAKAATRFDGLDLPEDLRRKLPLLKLAASPSPPRRSEGAAELTEITEGMEGIYGKGKYCRGGEPADCLDLGPAREDPGDEPQLRRAARRVARAGTRVAPPMRPKYARFVELANEGARELGFADIGALWRVGLRHDRRRTSRPRSSACGAR